MTGRCIFAASLGALVLAFSARPQSAGKASAGGRGAAQVLVVVNEASPLSREIGQYYVRRRGIPAGNVCRIRTAQEEIIERSRYSAQIAGAVAQCLRSRQLTEQILYIVTTAGVPLRIAGTGGPMGDTAAVDSELALLYFDLHHQRPHPVHGSVENPYFGKTEAAFTHARFPLYMVTRLAAYDLAGAKALVDRALAARNAGKVVIDLTSPGDEPGNNWLRTASLQVPKGRLVFDQSSKVLYGQTDVIAYAAWGSNDGNRRERFVGFRWLPGAIATEFVSTNGRTFERPPEGWNLSDWSTPAKWFKNSPQSLAADYLEEGASAATGHVAEPYLQATPRPDLLLPAYLSGRNLAESFYLSIPRLSWQNIVTGDPLMSLGPPPAAR
jgi:uncharacterized protein (TIGR03790 family)